MPPKNENIPSPAKPIVATPPRAGVNAFFFQNTLDLKTHGLTPGGKTLMPLQQHEGPHHGRVRSDANPQLIVSGDHPLSPSNKNNYEAQMLYLDALIVNLKNRSNHDYKIYQKNQAIDPAHFEATIVSIENNIKQIKTFCRLTPDPGAFLAELNQRIEQGKAYNPFGLKRIYDPKKGYNNSLARNASVFQGPIQISDIIPQQAAACAAKVEKRPPSVFVGLYEGIDQVSSGSGSPPPRKRRLDFLPNGDVLAKEELAGPSNPKI